MARGALRSRVDEAFQNRKLVELLNGVKMDFFHCFQERFLKVRFSSDTFGCARHSSSKLGSALACTKVLAMAKLKQVLLCSFGLTKSFLYIAFEISSIVPWGACRGV